jgi:hypothetical protein
METPICSKQSHITSRHGPLGSFVFFVEIPWECPRLDRLDSKVGDADCGSTMAKAQNIMGFNRDRA